LSARSIFVVVTRKFTDNIAINSDLRVAVHAMACPVPPSI
jgi:hypothetical protein